jgi:Tfp pilus assembly protein PilO
MQVRGNYHDIGYFFDKVAKLDRIVNIEDISMKKSSKKSSALQADIRLDAKFSTVTFKFIDESKVKKSSKGKRGRKRKKK